MNNIINIGRKVGAALVVVAVVVMPIASAQAADYSGGGYDVYDYSGDTGSSGYDVYDYSYADNSSGYDVYDYSDNSSGYDVYDYTYPSSGYDVYDYTYPTYSGGSYFYGGGGGGGGGCGSSCGCTHNCGGCTSNCGCTTGCVPPPAPTCTITLSVSSLTPGQPVTITWTSHNASSGTINGIGTVGASGSQTVYPTANTTYTGTFYGTNGHTVTCTCTVVVTPPPAAPVCTLTLSRNNIQFPIQGNNQPITLYWSSNNAQSGWINQSIGNVNLNGSRVVYPTQSTTYTGTFTGANGQTVTCSVVLNVTIAPVTPYVTLSAVPYTGLDLGPVGTAVYWGFLIAWCALAAYLIAIKRVHMSIYRWYSNVLFGSHETAHVSAHATHVHQVVTAPAPAEHTAIDPFILSQINRARN
jgi:hypothetical protein